MTCYVLDTDHLSLYERAHPQVCDRIVQVRRQSLNLLATTVVSMEEQYAGRLAQIRKAVTPQNLVNAYRKLKITSVLFSELDILDYTLDADDYFRSFKQAGIRIGTQDLRIAAIVLAHNGILLTRNLRDFEKVPRLSIQDWST